MFKGLMKLIFLDRLSNNPQILNLMEICQVRTQFFDADKQKDGRTVARSTTKLTVALRIFQNARQSGYRK